MLRLEVERLRASQQGERLRVEREISQREARIAELEKDRRFLHREEAALREKLEAQQKEAGLRSTGLQQETAQLRAQLAELREAKSEGEAERRRLAWQNEQLREQLAAASRGHARDAEASGARLARLEEQLAEKQQNITSLQEALLVANTSAVGSKFARGDEAALRALVPQEATLLERIERLETANRRLLHENTIYRESSRNHLILEERLHTAESTVAQLRQIEQQYHQLQAQSHSLHTAAAALPADGPIDGGTLRELMERTARLASLQESLGEVEASLRGARSEIEILNLQLLQMRQTLTEERQQAGELRQRLAVAQQQEAIWKTEIALLKEQIEAGDRVERTNQLIISNLNRKLLDPSSQPHAG